MDCEIVELSDDEGWEFFDNACRKSLSIPGEEFIRKYYAGDYAGADCISDEFDIMILLPFAGERGRRRELTSD